MNIYPRPQEFVFAQWVRRPFGGRGQTVKTLARIKARTRAEAVRLFCRRRT